LRIIDHANDILDFLAGRRNAKGRIAPISSVDLLIAMGRRPSDYAVIYGQANSLLDIASMEADQPLIGRLVLFDHSDDHSGAWGNWLQFGSLLYYRVPRLKAWSDGDLMAIRTRLRPGRPADLWSAMEDKSEAWLERALVYAQEVIRVHVDSDLADSAQ
jgi:hypothetical protein